jgi:hypothetical protein
LHKALLSAQDKESFSFNKPYRLSLSFVKATLLEERFRKKYHSSKWYEIQLFLSAQTSVPVRLAPDTALSLQKCRIQSVENTQQNKAHLSKTD